MHSYICVHLIHILQYISLDTTTHESRELTFPPTREEHLDDKHLQRCHCDHQATLDHAEIEYPLLRAPDRAKVSVFSRAEVLLLPGQGRDLAREFQDGLFHTAELLRGCAGLLR